RLGRIAPDVCAPGRRSRRSGSIDPMPSMADICADLRAESDDLGSLLRGLDEPTWDAATPAEGGAIRDTISHLNYFDDAALRAVVDPDAFRAWVSDTGIEEMRPVDGVTGDLVLGRSSTSSELLERWRGGRGAMLLAFAPLDPKLRVPWYGPDMSA